MTSSASSSPKATPPRPAPASEGVSWSYGPGERIAGTRWTFVRHAVPVQVGTRLRPQVRVRCVCGVERVHRADRFRVGTIMRTGCGSARCAAIFRVAERIRAEGFPLTMREFEARIESLCAEAREDARGSEE